MAEPVRETEARESVVRPIRVEPMPEGRVAGVQVTRGPDYQAYQILRVAFTLAPIIAGVDKFFHVLTDWNMYLSPIVTQMGIPATGFMRTAGLIEIIAGIGVALKPKVFAYIVSAWLLGITVNLLTTGRYYDVALRDFGLALGALALARLSQKYDLSRKRLA